MSQNDFTIANQTFPNTRADINSALQALASTSSGSSAPSTTFANQFFYDTTNNLLKIRNEDNDAFITICELDQSNDTVEYFKSDSIRTALIEFTDGDDALTIADGGALTTAGNLSIGGSNNELRFYEGANYVGFEAPALSADKIWVLPDADGSANQALVTNGSGTLSWAETGITRQNAKPLVINGDMAIAQRATSLASISGGDGYSTLDRMRLAIGTAGTWTFSQATDAPSGSGFATSLKMDCTTANTSLSAGSFLTIQHRLEGQDLQLLKKGTSSAEKVSVSFWVKSAKTGTYTLEIEDTDNSRHISQSYTISSANTWEKKVLSFAGDTTGTLGNDNLESLRLLFWLVAGSTYSGGTLDTSWASQTQANRAVGNVNLADSTSNDWYLTGVQLEVGEYDTTTIPPFQHESYGDNVSRCERYCQSSYSQGTAIGSATTAGVIIYNASGTGIGQASTGFPLRTVMRAVPTIVIVKSGGTSTGVGRNGNDASDVPLSAGAGSTSAMHVENSATVPNAVQIQFQFHATSEL